MFYLAGLALNYLQLLTFGLLPPLRFTLGKIVLDEFVDQFLIVLG